FWMSDKRPIQEDLAENLAKIIEILSIKMSLRYLEAMWAILLREWHGIDHLRLDKYYLLLRKFHFTTFRWLEINEWNQELVEDFSNLILKNILDPKSRNSEGIKLHTVEAMFEEMNN
ncbi:Ribosomal RNA processing protein 1 B, partial [Nowakowskiella sp. JEL0078]